MKKIFVTIILLVNIHIASSQIATFVNKDVQYNLDFSYYRDTLDIWVQIINQSAESVFFVKQLFSCTYYNGSLELSLGGLQHEYHYLMTLRELKPNDTIVEYAWRIPNVKTNLISLDINTNYLQKKDVKEEWLQQGLNFIDYYVHQDCDNIYFFSKFYLEEKK